MFAGDVPHVCQKTPWDCGMACAEMIVRYCNKQCDRAFEEMCEKNNERRLWTIEIAVLLHNLDVPLSMYTKTLGANEKHASVTYYKGSFDEDQQRVNDLFHSADKLGINIQRKSLVLEEILQELKQGNVFISLVNGNRMSCSHCCSLVMKIIKMVFRSSYFGHFVVVVGCDDYTQSVLYRDPASCQSLCSVRYSDFDVARKHPGSDEDLILVKASEVRAARRKVYEAGDFVG